MTEIRARKLLGNSIHPDGSLKATDDNWIEWPLRPDGVDISIDGSFTAEQLEALAWWLRNAPVPKISLPKSVLE